MGSKKIILNNQHSQNASMEILLGERIIVVTVMGRKNCRQIFSQIWKVKKIILNNQQSQNVSTEILFAREECR